MHVSRGTFVYSHMERRWLRVPVNISRTMSSSAECKILFLTAATSADFPRAMRYIFLFFSAHPFSIARRAWAGPSAKNCRVWFLSQHSPTQSTPITCTSHIHVAYVFDNGTGTYQMDSKCIQTNRKERGISLFLDCRCSGGGSLSLFWAVALRVVVNCEIFILL